MWQWLVNLFVKTEDRLFGVARSNQWPKVRAWYLSWHKECELCGNNKKLEIHHCIPVHIDQSKELDPDNLITLDKDCHFKLAHLTSFRSYNETIKADAALWKRKIKNRPQ